jgi:hypothetical protein
LPKLVKLEIMNTIKKSVFLPIVIALIAVSCKKNLPSVISLNGVNSIESTLNQPFQDPGAKATDTKGDDISDKIVSTGAVNINLSGAYQIFYDVTDKKGNKAVTATRTVKVVNSVDYLDGYYNISYSFSGTSTYSGSEIDQIDVSNTINNRFYLNTPFSFYAEVGDNGQVTVPLQQSGFNNQVQGYGQVQNNKTGYLSLQSQTYGTVAIQFQPQ